MRKRWKRIEWKRKKEERREKEKLTAPSVCTKMKTDYRRHYSIRNGRLWQHKQSNEFYVSSELCFSVRLTHDRSLCFQLRFESPHERRFRGLIVIVIGARVIFFSTDFKSRHLFLVKCSIFCSKSACTSEFVVH